MREKLHSKLKCRLRSFFPAILQQRPRGARGFRTLEDLEKRRILEKEIYNELLVSGLIIPLYFVCEMCEVFHLNQV